MADYLTNTTELTAVADAIRGKTGDEGDLIFPNGFVNAIEGISSGSSNLYILTQSPYQNTNVTTPSSSGYVIPMVAYQVPAGDTITFYTYGDYILDTITGVTTSSNIPYTTVQRGTYTFTMPNESVHCKLYYDD